MKLWLLRPVKNHRDLPNDPWIPWYDKNFGFVVRADDELAARTMTLSEYGDEQGNGTASPWLDSAWSTCVELTIDGESGVIIKDFAAA